MAKLATNLAARYLDLLADEGYRPKLEDSSGQQPIISFKSEGEWFLLFLDEDDEGFLGVGSWYDLGTLEHGAAVNLANELNGSLKVVKVTIAPEDRTVRFHSEAFLDEAPASVEQIQRAVTTLRNAARCFFEPAPDVDHLDA